MTPYKSPLATFLVNNGMPLTHPKTGKVIGTGVSLQLLDEWRISRTLLQSATHKGVISEIYLQSGTGYKKFYYVKKADGDVEEALTARDAPSAKKKTPMTENNMSSETETVDLNK